MKHVTAPQNSVQKSCANQNMDAYAIRWQGGSIANIEMGVRFHKNIMKQRIIIIGIFISLCIGCAKPTKPNLIYQDPVPSSLTKLEQRNPLLGKELRKLPELQDGVSPSEASALERIWELYKFNPASFDSAFERIHQIGLPEIRKYSSPLQAVFWLAEDNKFDRRIIQGVYESSVFLNLLLLNSWSDCGGSFSEGMKGKSQKRWGDFNTVTERLNAPGLVDYYTKMAFSYKYYLNLGASPRDAFKSKGGNCVEIEAFQRYCLLRGGYKASLVEVMSSGGGVWHVITLFYNHGQMYIMDNGRPHPGGIIGPIQSITEAGYTYR